MLPDMYIIIWDGKPVGLDSGSGGYPFKTDSPGSVCYWRTKGEAKTYMLHWPTHNWEVMRVSFRLSLPTQGEK